MYKSSGSKNEIILYQIINKKLLNNRFYSLVLIYFKFKY